MQADDSWIATFPMGEFIRSTGHGQRLHRVWLDWLIHEVPNLFQAERCAIFVPTSDPDTMLASHGTGLTGQHAIKAQAGSFAVQAFRERQILFVHDMKGHRPAQEALVQTGFVTHNLVCVPLTSSQEHEPFAVLEILNIDGSLHDLDIERLRNTSQTVGYTFENHEAQENMLRAMEQIDSKRTTKTQIISNNAHIHDRIAQLRAVSKTPAWVLIRGENGTGKELFTELLHEETHQGTQSRTPLVSINCAALPEQLLESELFGHEKGAFTGAVQSKPGLFETAQGGTLMLDEIGELPLSLQPKLLRALETRRARRLGGTQEYSFDFRLVSATHRDLEKSMEEGTFRQDLYYRLFSLEVIIPPLRDRPEDIELLAHHFLRMTTRAWDKNIPGFAADTLEQLRYHPWPGNVRELRREIERLVTLSPAGEPIAPHMLSNRIEHRTNPPVEQDSPLKTRVRHFERSVIEATLREVDNNKEEAARILNISKQTLYNKLAQI